MITLGGRQRTTIFLIKETVRKEREESSKATKEPAKKSKAQ